MHRQDFLHKDAETRLCEHYMAAGALCSLSTNSERLLEAARDTFLRVESSQAPVDFSLRFWIDGTGTPPHCWPKPYVRGLDHLVFAGFDAQSSVLADLRTRRVIGRFSAAMANDSQHWKTIIFPMLLSIMAGSVGIVELHASCVTKEEEEARRKDGGKDKAGLILSGPSRSGKSTLAKALTEVGFGFLSDDRTFCSLTQGKLQAWGLPRPLKLRRDAALWFEEFRDREPTDVQNGERVFHYEPQQKMVSKCEPRLLVFLERQERPGFSMTLTNKSEARSRLEEDLLAETPETVRKQKDVLDKLLSLPCCLLQYGGRPQEIALQLAAWFLSLPQYQLPSGGKWGA
jgi:hypothetical protein